MDSGVKAVNNEVIHQRDQPRARCGGTNSRAIP